MTRARARAERAIAIDDGPPALVAIADGDVQYVRRLSEELQERGIRVVLLTSSSNAVQLLAAARCDVLLVGERLSDPSGPDLCRLLREKLGGRRPWFVRMATEPAAANDHVVFDLHAKRSIATPELLSVVVKAVGARRAAAARSED